MSKLSLKIESRIKAGRTPREVEEELGCSRNTVYFYSQAAGLHALKWSKKRLKPGPRSATAYKPHTPDTPPSPPPRASRSEPHSR